MNKVINITSNGIKQAIDDLVNENDKLQEEIERLKEELKYTVPVVEHNKTITKHIKEKEQLHSIIKEVREYINSIGWNTTIPNIQDNVWRILDKEKE